MHIHNVNVTIAFHLSPHNQFSIFLFIKGEKVQVDFSFEYYKVFVYLIKIQY